jgi:hypothetical protein
MVRTGRRAVALVIAINASMLVSACATSGQTGVDASATAAEATLAPAAASTAFRILTPADGETVTDPTVTFAGIAPAGSTVVRDIRLAPDDSVEATDGTWTLDVELDEGVNEITIRLGDDESTARTLFITYAPATAEATIEPEPTAEPTPEPEPTQAPTPKPTKVSYKKLSDRSWRKVVKSPDAYIGKTYQLWACISQFDAATGDDTFRGQASNKRREYWYSDGENALFTGDSGRLVDFVQDDVVVMNVMVLGSFSYDTQIGGNTTAPWFSIDKITRKGSCD